MRILGNLFRSILYIGIAGFIGYHVHETQGVMGVGICAIFFLLGVLMFSTWQSGKSKAEKILEAQSLEEKKSPVTIVERPVNIVREEVAMFPSDSDAADPKVEIEVEVEPELETSV